MKANPIRLEIYKHLLSAIAEEMGVVLRRASYSPNIKERRDFSCALFDAQGKMIAQAAHIPVHLGSMPMSVAAAIQAFSDISPGDAILLNDPYRGGTHLPDITLVTPVFLPAAEHQPHALDSGNVLEATGDALFGFVASRAHHADVGGITAGSMPVAREIYQEGLIIPPVKIYQAGKLNAALWETILANVRTPQERAGDLWAQIAANRRGANRLLELVRRYGPGEVSFYMGELLSYAERMTRRLIDSLPDGIYSFTDVMDDDGVGEDSVPIHVSVTISGQEACVDFTGSAPQQKGSVNAVEAITLSAVSYVFRCLVGIDIPNNSGCLAPIRVIAPLGSIVNARPPAAVAAGNVETSQRIVDVLFGALAQACPDRVPAASQGTMNNLIIGGIDTRREGNPRPFTYYETIAGGMGARPARDGPSARHSHMTNTLNTPIEALEYAYPLRVTRYAIREKSGGQGKYHGGNGIIRDIQVLVPSQVTLLTERRRFQPYGLAGGQPGKTGENILIQNGQESKLPGKCAFEVKEGDTVSIATPGGGGYGGEDYPGGRITGE